MKYFKVWIDIILNGTIIFDIILSFYHSSPIWFKILIVVIFQWLWDIFNKLIFEIILRSDKLTQCYTILFNKCKSCIESFLQFVYRLLWRLHRLRDIWFVLCELLVIVVVVDIGLCCLDVLYVAVVVVIYTTMLMLMLLVLLLVLVVIII